MKDFLYILLGISILAPIYTYAIYPCVLRLFKPKSRNIKDDYSPFVTVLIIGEHEMKCKEKERIVREANYTNIAEVITAKSQKEAAVILTQIHSEVILVTDEDSIFQKNSISEVVKALSDPDIGCVCGMVRKQPNEQGEFYDGANWKYENKIKILESKIGCLSGANNSIYAYKRDKGPSKFDPKINLDFYIPTFITELGCDVCFESKAIAYEAPDRTESDLFKKHVKDGSSGFWSMIRFWKLLLPRKGSFVFWSHRVMKWLVPINMLILLIGCAVWADQQLWALPFFILQVLFYVYTITYYLLFTQKGKCLSGTIGKLSGFASYFVMLNVSWFLGFYKAITR